MNERIKKRKTPFDGHNTGESRVIHSVHISSLTVIKVVGVFVAVYFLWSIRDVLGILFVALVLASALDPWVDRMERFRVPRGVTILSMYLLIIFVLSLVVYLIVPPLVLQFSEIVASLTAYGPQIDSFYQYVFQVPDVSILAQIQSNISNFNQALTNFTSGVYSAVTGFVGTIAATIFVMVITFYMTIEEGGLKKFVRSIAPIQYQPYLVQKTNRIQEKMGAWLRGQLILMFIIFVVSFIGLFLLQVPYTLVLAFVAGLAEFVPFLGPVLASIPAIFFAYTDSPWKAVGVIILYFVLQQIENQVVVPKLMQKVVGLNPIVVILVMLIGAKVAGLIGILLAVPATTIVWIFLEDVFERKKELDNKLEQPSGEAEEE